MDVIVPGLGDEHDGVGVGGEQRRRGRDRWRPSGPARLVMPKAQNRARFVGLRFEEFGVERIGAGIAALDIVDAELVEHARRCCACLRARSRRRSSARRRAASCRRDRGVRGSSASLSGGSRRRRAAPSVLVMVVLAEPLVAERHEIAALGGEAQALEQGLRGVAGVAGQALRRRAPRRASSGRRSAPRRRRCRANSRVDIQHVDDVGALEAGEAATSPSMVATSVSMPRRALAEGRLVVGARRPGFALILVVVLGRRVSSMARREDFAAQRAASAGQIGAQARSRSSLDLPVVPSLLSLSATPSARVPSRSRSDVRPVLGAAAPPSRSLRPDVPRCGRAAPSSDAPAPAAVRVAMASRSRPRMPRRAAAAPRRARSFARRLQS